MRPGLPEAHYLRLARAATVVWGCVLLGIGIVARQWGSVLEAGLTIASIPFGALLGVFLLGVLTRGVKEPEAIAGVVAGLAAVIYVRFANADRLDLVRADRHHRDVCRRVSDIAGESA